MKLPTGANLKRDKEQYGRYKALMKADAPKTLAEFLAIKYNNTEGYETLRHIYRVASQYEINAGTMSARKITELHDKAVKQMVLFSRKGKDGANIAIMEIDSVK